MPIIVWFLTTSVVVRADKSVFNIRQLVPYSTSENNEVCGLNDVEQLGDIQKTIKHLQSLSKHCESTHAAFEKRIRKLEETIRQERRSHIDQLHKDHIKYRTILNQIKTSNARLDSLEQYVASLQSENSKLNDKLVFVKKKCVSQQSKHSTISDMLDSTRKVVTVLNLTVTTLSEGLESNKKDVFSLKSTMKETLGSLGGDVVLLKSQNSSLNEGLVSLNGVMNSLQSQHSALKENFTRQSESTEVRTETLNKNYQKMQRTLSETQTKYEKERVNASEKIAKIKKKLENGEMIFVVLSFAFVFWVAFSKMKSVNLTNPSKEKTSVIQSKVIQAEPAKECFHETTSIAHSKKSNISTCMVRKRKSMENSIGVVSFSRSGSDVHKELIESVRTLTKLSKEIHICHSVVTRAEDVCKIPPSKIVFVFVDANKRHIILEDPNQEIGGFRGQTVDAIKEMGCDVFVVYVRDKALDDGSLYHPRLTSIQRHHTLTSLSDTNRVLSLNTTFSEYQRDFLVKELQNTFNCSKTGIM